jgi:hypothetical protein
MLLQASIRRNKIKHIQKKTKTKYSRVYKNEDNYLYIEEKISLSY